MMIDQWRKKLNSLCKVKPKLLTNERQWKVLIVNVVQKVSQFWLIEQMETPNRP